MVEYLAVDKKSAGSKDAGSVNADAGSDSQGRRSQDGEFNFDKELQEYNGMVKEMELSNVQEGVRADLNVVTLEGTFYKLDWNINGGIKIVAIKEDGGDMNENPDDKKAYDDLNQMLQGKSPAYQQLFNEKLMKKLSNINKQIDSSGRRKSVDISPEE